MRFAFPCIWCCPRVAFDSPDLAGSFGVERVGFGPTLAISWVRVTEYPLKALSVPVQASFPISAPNSWIHCLILDCVVVSPLVNSLARDGVQLHSCQQEKERGQFPLSALLACFPDTAELAHPHPGVPSRSMMELDFSRF